MSQRRLGLESCELCLSQHAVWFGCSVLAWFTAIWASAKIGLAGLLICSIVVAAVTIALRMPVLAFVRFGNRWVTQAVWLLGCMASLNWLGFLLLSPLEARDALPGVLILLAAEGWLHWQAAQRRKLPWLFNRITKALRLLAPGPLLADPQSSIVDESTLAERRRERGSQDRLFSPRAQLRGNVAAADVSDVKAAEVEAALDVVTAGGDAAGGSTDLEVGGGADAAEEGRTLLRRSYEGIDEQGRRYQSGEVQVDFAADQSLTSAVITFCTAFAGTPAVDLEYEPLKEAADGEDESGGEMGDELTIRPVHTTPSGLRLNLRRKNAVSAGSYRLLWYAYLESSVGEAPPARSVLP